MTAKVPRKPSVTEWGKDLDEESEEDIEEVLRFSFLNQSSTCHGMERTRLHNVNEEGRVTPSWPFPTGVGFTTSRVEFEFESSGEPYFGPEISEES